MQGKDKAACRSSRSCAICLKEDFVADIAWISCNECEKYFHQKCAATESTDIEGIWHCNECLKKAICQACFESDPMAETDGDKISWVACDNCDNWYHVVCVVGYVDKSKEWFCTTCK